MAKKQFTLAYIPQVRQITFIFRLLDLLPKLDFSHFQLIIKICLKREIGFVAELPV
jgi:hypothetical protein